MTTRERTIWRLTVTRPDGTALYLATLQASETAEALDIASRLIARDAIILGEHIVTLRGSGEPC